MTVPELEVSMLLVATGVAFLLSGAYYTVVPRSPADGGEGTAGAMSPWLIVAELLRALVLVTVVAILTSVSGVRGWGEGWSSGWCCGSVFLSCCGWVRSCTKAHPGEWPPSMEATGSSSWS